MKPGILLSITFSILTTITFGQTKYIQTMEGAIVGTYTYEKMKAEHVKKITGTLPAKNIKVAIKDNFKEIRRTPDSLIYSYNWEIKIGDSKVKEDKSFEPENYLDKEFPIPALTTVNNRKISINSLKGKDLLKKVYTV